MQVCGTKVIYSSDWSVLQPADDVCSIGGDASDKTNTIPSYLLEVASMIQIVMFLGLLFLLLVMVRSCNRTKMDWYRLIALYIIGTLGVPISILLGPKIPGFNRVAGFGVLTHNMTELFIIGRIWFGKYSKEHNSFGAKFIVMYVWAMSTLLTFLPLSPLFFIAMLQGAFCDWALAYTFIKTGEHMQRYNQYNKIYFWAGFAAATTHALSIQPLFFGFALGCSYLNGITVIFLIPTFIIYIWFASDDSETGPNIIDPIPTSLFVLDEKRNQELQTIINLSNVNGNGDDNDLVQRKSDAVDENIISSIADQTGDNGYSDLKTRKLKTNPAKQILETGIVGDPDIKNPKKLIGTVAIFGFFTCLFNTLIVWLSPCYFTKTSGDIHIIVLLSSLLLLFSVFCAYLGWGSRCCPSCSCCCCAVIQKIKKC